MNKKLGMVFSQKKIYLVITFTLLALIGILMVQFSWIDAAINIQKQQFDEQVATPREADLLTLFCKRKGDLLTRERALKEIWGEKNYFNRRIMDVYISKLRKYLSGDPDVEIKNIHSKGFILSDES